MRRFGNVLTEDHKEALYCILGRFTMLATGAVTGRYAYDLPCGGGKTQAVVAWCTAAAKMRRRYSVSVCASKVEALCELKRDLVANGVPESEIGLIHSYSFDPATADKYLKEAAPLPDKYASLPATADNHQRQFVLITHARVRGKEQAERFNVYRGKRRDLVIWDESLLISDHRAIEVLGAAKGIGYLEPDLKVGKASADLEAAIHYAKQALIQIENELDQQRTYQRAPRVLTLPALDSEGLSELVEAVPQNEATKPVRHLLEMSQSPLRCVNTNGGGGLVTYDVVVPPELRNVAVLDASWAIRDLERLDRTIADDPLFHGDVKRYDAVTIHQLRHAAGRSAMEMDFERKREARTVSREVVEVIRGIPETEAVLLFTFKPRGKINMAETLRSDLQAAGVDTNAELPNGKPRFVWLTFGQETSVSAYKFCPNVIFVGALHRSMTDLAGAIVGQLDDLRAPLEPPAVLAVRTSEVVHVLYQGINRAACRDTDNGQAKPTRAWLIYPDTTIRPALEGVMPGVQWREWEPVYLERRTGKIEELTEKIEGYLRGLPPETLRVSSRRLKADLGLSDCPARTVAHAVSSVALEGWTLEGRSWVRSS